VGLLRLVAVTPSYMNLLAHAIRTGHVWSYKAVQYKTALEVGAAIAGQVWELAVGDADYVVIMAASSMGESFGFSLMWISIRALGASTHVNSREHSESCRKAHPPQPRRPCAALDRLPVRASVGRSTVTAPPHRQMLVFSGITR